MRPFLAAMLSSIAMLAPVNTAMASAANGEVIARRWCASCHVIAPDQKTGTTQAPPFSAIEARSEIERDKLALFLMLPHPQMPDMSLTRREAEDLADYILRQRPVKLPIELPVIGR